MAAWLRCAPEDVEKRLTRKGKRLSDRPVEDNSIRVTVEMTDDIPCIINLVGDNNLVVGADHGRTDNTAQIEALRLPNDRDGISPASGDRILGPNRSTL